ncbi:MAG TPA: hypothetical protein VHE12_12770 [bacterium]|nr:hypothetical protein [bacterium]
MPISIIVVILLAWAISRAWAYYIEQSSDIPHIRLLEPWYWFLLLNIFLTPISSNFDPELVGVGLFIQVVLSIWFAVSIGWIIGSCPHKAAYHRQSPFHKGLRILCCYRCGTPLPPGEESILVENRDWKVLLFQIPPSLLEYVTFWVAQSLMVLIGLFLVFRVLHHPDAQHKAVLASIVLIVFVPPALFFWGRFRNYLKENQGMIWWADLKRTLLAWGAVLVFLWLLFHFWLFAN